jgi:hypothetical protein
MFSVDDRHGSDWVHYQYGNKQRMRYNRIPTDDNFTSYTIGIVKKLLIFVIRKTPLKWNY